MEYQYPAWMLSTHAERSGRQPTTSPRRSVSPCKDRFNAVITRYTLWCLENMMPIRVDYSVRLYAVVKDTHDQAMGSNTGPTTTLRFRLYQNLCAEDVQVKQSMHPKQADSTINTQGTRNRYAYREATLKIYKLGPNMPVSLYSDI